MCRWGAVAIVTVPGVYPTSVGSAWVEDGAGSKGVQLQRRRAAHSTVGTCVCVCVCVCVWRSKVESSGWPVIITFNTEQRRGEENKKSQERGGWVGLEVSKKGTRKQSKV